ncbi:MAG: ABC transporter permease [Armatimonadetes bacterium]|nr:ABC transporter permease [Armatimonadota bacterium]
MISLFQILKYSAPVAFGAVGESAVQRSGIINVGLEGLMLSAAFAATVASDKTGNPWIGLAAGVAVGVAVALFLGILTIRYALDQIVVGTAINLLALGVCGTLFEKQGATGKLLNLPAIPPLFGKFDVILLLLIVASAGLGYVLYRTPFGLKLRAVGEYPPAAEAAGFSPAKIRYQALVIGGLFGGLGGAYLVLGVAQSFATEMVAGRGFIAIALVTFARWRPFGILLSAMLLGFFEALQFSLQLDGSNIPRSLLLALPYVATLVILVFVGKGTRAPQSLGTALDGTDS